MYQFIPFLKSATYWGESKRGPACGRREKEKSEKVRKRKRRKKKREKRKKRKENENLIFWPERVRGDL